MTRRRQSRARQTEPAVIAQANPTPEQRARSQFVEATVPNPAGAVVTITTRNIDGEPVTERVIHQHKVCRRQPVYVTLHGRGGICDNTRKVLDWYDGRYWLSVKGLTHDSLAITEARSGGSGYCPTDGAMNARSDVEWARSYIRNGDELRVFRAVMEEERTLTEIGGHHGAGKERAAKLFKLAANWLLLGVGSRILEPTR